MITRFFVAGLLAAAIPTAEAWSQFEWQQGWVVPPRDQRQRRLLKERVVIYAGPAARGFVEAGDYGDDAALALSMCSQGTAQQLAAFHAAGGLSRLPCKRELLRLIAQPNCQDAVALWVMQHAGELSDPVCMDRFLASPAEYVLGLNSLPRRVQEAAREEPAAVYLSPAPAYYAGSGNARLSKQQGAALGAGLLVAVVLYVWWKRRRQACDLPA